MRTCKNVPLDDLQLIRSTLGFRTQLAVNYLRCHFADQDICLCLVAKEIGVSPAYLSRLLSAKPLDGFRRLIRTLRMYRAAELLQNPLLSVKEVAGMVGYRHTSSFDRDFRSHYLKTPGRYRAESVQVLI